LRCKGLIGARFDLGIWLNLIEAAIRIVFNYLKVMSRGPKESNVTEDHIIGLPKASNRHGNRVIIVPVDISQYARSNVLGRGSITGV